MAPSIKDEPRPISKLGFILALGGLSLILGGFFFFESSYFKLKNIQIIGDIGISKAELVEKMQLNRTVNIFQLDQAGLQKVLHSMPEVREAKIERKLPNTLVVRLFRREPFCMIARSEGLWVVSSDGVILARTKAGKNPRLPILVGLKQAKITDEKPGRINDVLFRQGVSLLNMAGDELRDELVEVDLKQNVLYTWDGIRVELGDKRSWALKITSLKALLASSDRQRIGIIDLRLPNQPIISGRP